MLGKIDDHMRGAGNFPGSLPQLIQEKYQPFPLAFRQLFGENILSPSHKLLDFPADYGRYTL